MADHIQIGDTAPRIQYTQVSAGNVTFTYPFPIFADGDLVVFVDGAAQTLTTHYAVTGAGDSGGGTVVFVAAPALDAVVTLVRRVVIKRETDFQESGEFRAKVINDELDTRVAVEQQLADDIGRALRQDDSDVDGDLTLPLKADRLGRVLAFDAVSGDPVAGATGTDIANAAAYAAQVAADKIAVTDLLADLGVPAVPTFAKTVTGTDVTNGYLDLAGFDPSDQANIACAVDGVVQEPVVDFTAADNAGTWRLTWGGTSGFAPAEGNRVHIWRRGGAYSSGGGGGGGVTDHGALSGLGDDDHPQYHTDARGDARYYTQAQVAALLAGYVVTSRTVGAGTGLTGGGALSANITLNVSFAGTGAAATAARSDHNHDAAYSAIGHNHDASYSALGHSHDLGDLSDVDLTGLANGYVLKYNSTSGNWEPAADDSGGGGANLWSAIAADSGTNPVPDTTTDTLTLEGGAGIATVGDAAADKVTFSLDIAGLTAKATPVDADVTVIADSADSDKPKKVTWANVKATLKTYFDGLYLALAGGTMAGALNMADNEIQRPTLKDVDLTVQAIGSQAATVAADFENGNVATATLAGAGMTVSIANWPAGEAAMRLYLTQDATGGRTVTTWPVDKWVGGSAPTLGTGAGDVDLVVVTSPDGGTTRIGTHVGTAS